LLNSWESGCAALDLQKARPAGTIKDENFEGDCKFPAISPDGEHVVDCDFFGHEIRIWSFKRGAIVHQIKTGDLASAVAVHFVDPQRLLVVIDEKFQNHAEIYSVADGSRIRRFSIERAVGKRATREAIAVSPGGNQLAVLIGTTLMLHDLNSGELIGRSRVSDARDKGPSGWSGLAFSPDGTRLAAVARWFADRRIVCWDVESGEPLVDRNAECPDPRYRPENNAKHLVWLPDCTAFVVEGKELIDAETAMPIWSLPEGDLGKPHPLENSKLLIAHDGSLTQPGKITLLTIPQDEVNKSRELVRSGGRSEDMLLPALTETDLSAVRQTKMPEVAVAWSAEFAPARPPEGLMPEPIEAGRTGLALRDIKFSSGPAKTVSLLHGPAEPGDGGAARSQLESFDLASGDRKCEIDLPGDYRLIGLSGDGSLAALGFVEEKGKSQPGATEPADWSRLDIWALGMNKHALGFRPYNYAADPEAQSANWCGFTDKRHALTTSSDGTLVKWEFPSCKALYAIEAFGKALALSADGKYVLGWISRTDVIRVVDTQTGNCCGELHTGEMWTGGVMSGALSIDGQRFAAIVLRNGVQLAVWSLTDGNLVDVFHISDKLFAGDASLAWVDPRYVLVAKRFLIDIENHAVAWQYALTEGMLAGDSPDGRLWYSIPGLREGSQQLVATRLPSDRTRELSAGLKMGDQVTFRPGVPVRVVANIDARGSDSATAQRMISERLEAAGIPIDPNSELRVTYVCSEEPTDQTVNYKSFRGGGRRREEISINLVALAESTTLAYTDGTVVWETSKTNTYRPSIMAREDPQKEYDESVKRGVVSRIRNFELPKYLFLNPDELGAGRSELGLGGESAL
jgi:WD40 repeat protein